MKNKVNELFDNNYGYFGNNTENETSTNTNSNSPFDNNINCNDEKYIPYFELDNSHTSNNYNYLHMSIIMCIFVLYFIENNYNENYNIIRKFGGFEMKAIDNINNYTNSI